MVGDGLVYAAQHKARRSTEDAGRKAIQEEAERKAKAAEELKNQQEAADDTKKALLGLVPKLAEKPDLLKKIITQFTDPSLYNGAKTIAQIAWRDVGKKEVISLYSALNAAKVELVPEKVIPYLLNNGLLEALSTVTKEQANKIFENVINLPFIADIGFKSEDHAKLAEVFDKAMDIVEVCKNEQHTLAQLGPIVAEIGFPKEVDPNETQNDKKIRVALANNRIYVALKTVLPTLAEDPGKVSVLVTQLAKTADFDTAGFDKDKIKDIRDRQELIKNIDAALEQGVNLDFYLRQQENKKKREKLSEEIRNGSQDDPIIVKKTQNFKELQEELMKLVESTESNQLSPEERKQLEDRKKLLEGLATPLDEPRLYISETLGLNPGELRTLARFAEQPIKDLLAEKPAEGKTKLVEDLVGIINVAETERAAKFMELAPRIVQNHSASITRFLGNNEVKEIIRNNTFLQRQIAAQGFEGQEQRVINLALDQVYPDLIRPALQDRSLVTLLEKTLAPEASTADQVNAAIDFASTHQVGIGSVIDAVTKTYEEETKEGDKTIKVTKFENIVLVQAALARAGAIEGEDLAKLAPQISGVIRENKQGLLDLTAAVAEMDPELRKLILEEVLPAKLPDEGVLKTGASPTQDAFGEEEIVKREGLIKVYRDLTHKSEDHEIPAEFTTEMLETTIRAILAQKVKNEGTESSRSVSISSEEDERLSQSDSLRSSSVDSQVDDRERHSDATALREQEPSVDVVNPLHEAAKESSSTKKEASSEEAAPLKEPALASFLDEYQSHIPKILSSATPLVKALSSEDLKGATKNLVEGVSNLIKTQAERELLESSQNINPTIKKEIEDREKGLLMSVVMQGLSTAKNPEVLKATKQAIKDNRELLVNVADKQLEQLRASEDNWFLNRINGQFIVKAIEHANNPKSLEAIEKFVSKPSISGAIYLAWKTNNVKIAIGAVAGYFKKKEEEKQKETPEKRRESLESATVPSPLHRRNLSVSSRRSSISRH